MRYGVILKNLDYLSINIHKKPGDLVKSNGFSLIENEYVIEEGHKVFHIKQNDLAEITEAEYNRLTKKFEWGNPLAHLHESNLDEDGVIFGEKVINEIKSLQKQVKELQEK